MTVVPTHVILFYCYTPLSSDEDVMNRYHESHLKLVTSLQLTGRLLIGKGKNEGVNGTFSGGKRELDLYCYALGGNLDTGDSRVDEFLATFKELNELEASVCIPPFIMPYAEFKWSENDTGAHVFPDTYIKVVDEIVSSGGKLGDIALEETGKGYLTPNEFHAAVQEYGSSPSSDTVLIDCRNDKEVLVGQFENAVNPRTKTFYEFPKWVEDESKRGGVLEGKKNILMYCTGGIRCEKASAYVRSVTRCNVSHLKGGIHRYLESYPGSEALFKGKNFVFDSRQTVGGEGGVGRCIYCDVAWDEFRPRNVCTVCREQLLVCTKCEAEKGEYHCFDHKDLGDIYFTDLSVFNEDELRGQRDGLVGYLENISVGKRWKSRRRTVMRQMEKIDAFLEELHGERKNASETVNPACRSCGGANCKGSCWGYFGNNRREVLESKKSVAEKSKKLKANYNGVFAVKKGKKKGKKKGGLAGEIGRLGLHAPLSSFVVNGMRVVPPYLRTLSCNTKGKWAGERLLTMVESEFVTSSNPLTNDKALELGVMLVNGNVVGREYRMKQGDICSRTICAHEPPVWVGDKTKLGWKKVEVPSGGVLYALDKPTGIPVHPVGQYFGNSLTIVAEKEIGLEPNTLHPLHRVDKPVSGLVICAVDKEVAKVISQKIQAGAVRKVYVAEVEGDFRKIQWVEGEVSSEEGGRVKVDRKVFCENPKDGFRIVDERGKEATSVFEFLKYDAEGDFSIIRCTPVTGRGHQLRLHLKSLGHPIVGDKEYGGRIDGVGEDLVVETMLGVGAGMNGEGESAGGARSLCPICTSPSRETIFKCFKSDQLLQHGSRICLHAWKYTIEWEEEEGGEGGETTPLVADLPEWAKEVEMPSS